MTVYELIENLMEMGEDSRVLLSIKLVKDHYRGEELNVWLEDVKGHLTGDMIELRGNDE